MSTLGDLSTGGPGTRLRNGLLMVRVLTEEEGILLRFGSFLLDDLRPSQVELVEYLCRM
jgi:hypothetical protein